MQQVTLRLDRDVLAYFRAKGRGWQKRLNEALRSAMAEEMMSRETGSRPCTGQISLPPSPQ
jgi:hypothetical protein